MLDKLAQTHCLDARSKYICVVGEKKSQRNNNRYGRSCKIGRISRKDWEKKKLWHIVETSGKAQAVTKVYWSKYPKKYFRSKKRFWWREKAIGMGRASNSRKVMDGWASGGACSVFGEAIESLSISSSSGIDGRFIPAVYQRSAYYRKEITNLHLLTGRVLWPVAPLASPLKTRSCSSNTLFPAPVPCGGARRARNFKTTSLVDEVVWIDVVRCAWLLGLLGQDGSVRTETFLAFYFSFWSRVTHWFLWCSLQTLRPLLLGLFQQSMTFLSAMASCSSASWTLCLWWSMEHDI